MHQFGFSFCKDFRRCQNLTPDDANIGLMYNSLRYYLYCNHYKHKLYKCSLDITFNGIISG